MSKFAQQIKQQTNTHTSLNPIADSELDEFDTQAVRFKPESLDNLVKLTKFNKRELKLMYRGFKQVSCVVNKRVFVWKHTHTHTHH